MVILLFNVAIAKKIANYCFSINHLEAMPLLQFPVIKKGGSNKKKSLAKGLSASLTHQELNKTFLIATAKIKIRRHLSSDMDAATLSRGLTLAAEKARPHTSMKWFISSSPCGW